MKCPYCVEDIEDDAVVCKHCQRDLVPALSLQIFKNLEGDLHVLKSSIVLPTFVGFAILAGLVSGLANYLWWLTPPDSLVETATKVSFLVVGPLTALLLGRFLPGSSLLGYLLIGFLSGIGYIVSEALQVQVLNPGGNRLGTRWILDSGCICWRIRKLVGRQGYSRNAMGESLIAFVWR